MTTVQYIQLMSDKRFSKITPFMHPCCDNEWVYVWSEKRLKKDGRCICGTLIKNINYLVSGKTLQVAQVANDCCPLTKTEKRHKNMFFQKLETSLVSMTSSCCNKNAFDKEIVINAVESVISDAERGQISTILCKTHFYDFIEVMSVVSEDLSSRFESRIASLKPDPVSTTNSRLTKTKSLLSAEEKKVLRKQTQENKILQEEHQLRERAQRDEDLQTTGLCSRCGIDIKHVCCCKHPIPAFKAAETDKGEYEQKTYLWCCYCSKYFHVLCIDLN